MEWHETVSLQNLKQRIKAEQFLDEQNFGQL